jgi:hypothetical protein
MRSSSLRFVLIAAIGMTAGVTAPLRGGEPGNDVAARGVCERDAEKVTGEKPVRLGGDVRAPRRIRKAFPPYPETPGIVGQGSWQGEILIDSSGKVARVWPLREITFTPPLPSYNQAIVDAVQPWEYEPLLVEGTPMPFCTTVSMAVFSKR